MTSVSEPPRPRLECPPFEEAAWALIPEVVTQFCRSFLGSFTEISSWIDSVEIRLRGDDARLAGLVDQVSSLEQLMMSRVDTATKRAASAKEVAAEALGELGRIDSKVDE
ncbi:hypothetical protein KIPB_012034, partial [Kipferlia bialata]|eukprot:g12034.t1